MPTPPTELLCPLRISGFTAGGRLTQTQEPMVGLLDVRFGIAPMTSIRHSLAGQPGLRHRPRSRCSGAAPLSIGEGFPPQGSPEDFLHSVTVSRHENHLLLRAHAGRTSGSRGGACAPPAPTEPDLWASHPALRDAGVPATDLAGSPAPAFRPAAISGPAEAGPER